MATVTAVQPPGRFGALDVEGERVRRVRGEAARRRRLDQRRLLRALAGRRPVPRGRRARSGSRSRCARSPRTASSPATGTTASGSRWTRCATATTSRSCGARHASVAGLELSAPMTERAAEHRHRRPRLLARPARAGHRPHRLQGRLAVALAAVAGRRVTGFSAGVPDRALAVRAGSRGGGDGERRWATCATADAIATALADGAGRRSSSTWPHSRWCAAPSPSPRDLRDQRDGHRQPARRRPHSASGVRAVVNVTSDKCYENREWEWGYREDEPMGGHDPYSSSKGCAELVTAAYRRSFFSDPDGPRLASARAGNVIGGGDWGEDRLVPDVMRAALAGEHGAGPQPQLDPPLAARAQPAQRLPGAGPGDLGVAGAMRAAGTSAPPRRTRDPSAGWSSASPSSGRSGFAGTSTPGHIPTRPTTCKLDSSLARSRLGWRPLVSLEMALAETAAWYRELAGGRRHATR